MLRIIVAILLTVFSNEAALSQDRPPGYAEAAIAFEALPLRDRIHLQVKLTAAGFWPAVPNAQFNGRLFSAIGQYQTSIGSAPTGTFTATELDQLDRAAQPVLQYWGLHTTSHPATGAQIWVPFGLNLKKIPVKNGTTYQNEELGLRLDFEHYSNLSIDSAYEAWLRILQDRGTSINFKIKKSNFYAISGELGLKSYYVRANADTDGITGFFFTYPNTDASLKGDRLQTLISASLWASLSAEAPVLSLPAWSFDARNAPPQSPATPVVTEPSAPDPHHITAGTGFLVDISGHILTNAHVVRNCTDINVKWSDRVVKASVAFLDSTNDLAVLNSGLRPSAAARFRSGVRLGEAVAAFGYPLVDTLSRAGNFTLGNVTALAGIGDNTGYLQISTPVQPGNSGGPLLDASGNVVGIVTAKLNALKAIADNNGDIPQNVNFAIKSSIATSFLESSGISFNTGSLELSLKPEDIADRAKALSAFIVCQ